MNEWKKTSSVLCSQNGGLKVTTEGDKIVKVRGNEENPRSQGYLCRKGANVMYFQNIPERLKYPVKRVGNRFERIGLNNNLQRQVHGKVSFISWRPVLFSKLRFRPKTPISR